MKSEALAKLAGAFFPLVDSVYMAGKLKNAPFRYRTLVFLGSATKRIVQLREFSSTIRSQAINGYKPEAETLLQEAISPES